MTAVGIVWRAGVLEQGVAGHGLDYAGAGLISASSSSMLNCSNGQNAGPA
jgi:hypothetical protein